VPLSIRRRRVATLAAERVYVAPHIEALELRARRAQPWANVPDDGVGCVAVGTVGGKPATDGDLG
jgi:hypothetical protein